MDEPEINREAYPRPQLRRDNWTCLNGSWEFAIDPDARWADLSAVEWSRSIVVPFSPETLASGINDCGFYKTVWYRREFSGPTLRAGERVLLHFGAVDYCATVWVNHRRVCTHQGGYTPFAADITDVLAAGDVPQQIIVKADDDPLDLAKPRGKQDWKLEPHSIWYPRTTGIWQTVWFEIVPASFIETLRWTSNLKRWEIGLEARLGGKPVTGASLAVQIARRCANTFQRYVFSCGRRSSPQGCAFRSGD